MIAFASKENQCKQKELLAYFGEEKKKNVNNAPQNVVKKKKTSLDITVITQEIVEILQKGYYHPTSLNYLCHNILLIKLQQRLNC